MELFFARPHFLPALALPLALLLWLCRPRRPDSQATGTFALWRAQAGASAAAAARRARPPAWAWPALLALLAAALALSGPRAAAARPRRYTLVLDRSPAMGLPWRNSAESSAAPADPRRTRLAAALAAAEAWLAAHAAAADRVRWTAPEREAWEGAPGERPPAEWLAPARTALARPDWIALDLPGQLFVTDHVPAPAPARAGLFASGGAAVPGPIGALRRGTEGLDLVWDGERVQERPAAGPPPLVALQESAPLPAAIAELCRIWAAERGLTLVEGERSGAELVLRGTAAGGQGRARAGRDGWAFEFAGTSAARAGPDPRRREVWLQARSPAQVLIDAAPGEIRVHAAEVAAIEGDPAAVAVSFAELFDGCLLPPLGAVPLALRQDAGAPAEIPPRAPAPPAFDAAPPAWRPGGPALDAYLAALAALLAALAAWVRR